jgi:hypothetical protein
VLGIDFSAKTIELARKLSSGVNPSYRVQSVFDLDERQVFDVVITWGCLTMACKNRVELREALARIRTALKTDGTIAVFEPIHRGFVHRVLDMDLPEFCEVMRAVGFEVGPVRQLYFWPARFALAYVSWPRLLTRVGYSCGQGLMQLRGMRQMGDYKAIRATVSPGCQQQPSIATAG